MKLTNVSNIQKTVTNQQEKKQNRSTQIGKGQKWVNHRRQITNGQQTYSI